MSETTTETETSEEEGRQELPAGVEASALNAAQRLAVGRALQRTLEQRSLALWGTTPQPGYDHHLWEVTADEGTVEDRDARVLAELCDGWWVWEETGPLFVSLNAWEERRRAREGDPGADPDAGSAQAEAMAGTERTSDSPHPDTGAEPAGDDRQDDEAETDPTPAQVGTAPGAEGSGVGAPSAGTSEDGPDKEPEPGPGAAEDGTREVEQDREGSKDDGGAATR